MDIGWNWGFGRKKWILEKSCQSYHRLRFPPLQLVGLANMKTKNGILEGGNGGRREGVRKRRTSVKKRENHYNEPMNRTKTGTENEAARTECPPYPGKAGRSRAKAGCKVVSSGRNASNPPRSARLAAPKTGLAHLRPPSPTLIFL